MNQPTVDSDEMHLMVMADENKLAQV